ncbi:MAG: hypothetical protein LBG48_02640 [Rickettsiales bacterium]|jgi:hypothetical protein|nr:hypothetical protein [Rickettsiales bacterium]
MGLNIEELISFFMKEYINEHNKRFGIPLIGNRIEDIHRPSIINTLKYHTTLRAY